MPHTSVPQAQSESPRRQPRNIPSRYAKRFEAGQGTSPICCKMIYEHVAQLESRLDGVFSKTNPGLHEKRGCAGNVCIHERKLMANLLIGHWHASNMRLRNLFKASLGMALMIARRLLPSTSKLANAPKAPLSKITQSYASGADICPECNISRLSKCGTARKLLH